LRAPVGFDVKLYRLGKTPSATTRSVPLGSQEFGFESGRLLLGEAEAIAFSAASDAFPRDRADDRERPGVGPPLDPES
jgi:hypothetical protein